MPFSYKPLWKLLIEHEISKTELRNEIGISPATLAKLSKNEYVSLEVIDRICSYFQTQPQNIMEWKDDGNANI